VNDELLLWAFRRACSDQPAECTIYYDALVKIKESSKRNGISSEIERLGNQGNWQGN
jgi:hypothetical protein